MKERARDPERDANALECERVRAHGPLRHPLDEAARGLFIAREVSYLQVPYVHQA
jgi:hypothetical protein